MVTALTRTADVLAARPDLKGLFGASEPAAIGLGRALKQSGRADRVVGVGCDGNQNLRDFVDDGTLAAIVVRGSFRMGELGVAAIARVLAKQKVENFIDTGIVRVAKENIWTDEARNVLY